MNALTFAAGIALGALVTFAFVFITIAIASHDVKKRSSKMDNAISDDLIRELWHEYIKETKDENGRNNNIQ